MLLKKYESTYLEPTVRRDRPRELRVQVLLVRRARAKPLLPQHLAQAQLVIVRVHTDDLARLWIPRVDLCVRSDAFMTA